MYSNFNSSHSLEISYHCHVMFMDQKTSPDIANLNHVTVQKSDHIFFLLLESRRMWLLWLQVHVINSNTNSRQTFYIISLFHQLRKFHSPVYVYIHHVIP